MRSIGKNLTQCQFSTDITKDNISKIASYEKISDIFFIMFSVFLFLQSEKQEKRNYQ